MPVKEYLTPEDTSLIEAAATCLRDQLLIRLLRRLGCRIGEVLGLEEKHIDFSRRQVRIEHEKMHITLACPQCGAHLGKSSVFCPKCGNRVEQAVAKEKETRRLRKIPVDQDTLQLIRDYIKQGGITEVRGKRMLFSIGRQRAWQIVIECAERAGFNQLENPETEKLRHVSPHRFRDSFATNWVNKMPNLDDTRILQEILGHQNIGTTLKYFKVSGTEMQERYDDLLKKEK